MTRQVRVIRRIGDNLLVTFDDGFNTTTSNALTLVQGLQASVSGDIADAVTQATNANNAANNALSAAQTANQNASSADASSSILTVTCIGS